MVKDIVIAHSKGGSGKSTLAGILLEAFEQTGLVDGLDLDPQGSFRRRIEAMVERGFQRPDSPALRIVDTRGELGARALDADLVLVPIGPTEDEIQVSADFLRTLPEESRKRVMLAPIRFQLVGRSLIREHHDALQYARGMADALQLAGVLPWITYRPLLQKLGQTWPENPFLKAPKGYERSKSFRTMIEECRDLANGLAYVLDMPELEVDISRPGEAA